MGLHNSIQHFDFRKDINKLMENVVCIDLLRYGYEVYVGKSGNKEIDFIGEKNGEKLYIQVALKIDSEKTAEREFGNLLKIQDNYPKMVITEDNFNGNSYEGIRHCSIRQFLME